MKILTGLVKIESLSGKENELATFLLKHLISLGLKPFLQGENVLLHVKGKNPGTAIIFNAHMDTVPPGNLSTWKHPPVGKDAGVCIGNKLYGLGASDDKSGIAALLLLAEDLLKEKPKCDVWITFVVKEEVDGSGTKDFLEWFKTNDLLKKYQNISAIICEPTDLEEIKIGHRGTAFIGITVYGDGGHGSKPHTIKTNAITEAYKIIHKLKELDTEWKKTYTHSVLGEPTVSITTISGGNPLSPNKFADSCLLTLDIRTTPRLQNIVIPLLEKALESWNISIKELYTPTPFGSTDPNEKIVVKAKQITNAKVTINIGTNDLCFFTMENIPAIIFGPGIHATIHKANEYCKIDKIYEAVNIYKQLINIV